MSTPFLITDVPAISAILSQAQEIQLDWENNGHPRYWKFFHTIDFILASRVGRSDRFIRIDSLLNHGQQLDQELEETLKAAEIRKQKNIELERLRLHVKGHIEKMFPMVKLTMSDPKSRKMFPPMVPSNEAKAFAKIAAEIIKPLAVVTPKFANSNLSRWHSCDAHHIKGEFLHSLSVMDAKGIMWSAKLYNGRPVPIGTTSSHSGSTSFPGFASLAEMILKNQEESKKKDAEAMERLKLYMKYVTEHDLEVSSPGEIYKVVDDHAREEFRKNLIGEEIHIKCCDECSAYVVGERRCACGNTRVELVVEGSYPNFYAGYERY